MTVTFKRRSLSSDFCKAAARHFIGRLQQRRAVGVGAVEIRSHLMAIAENLAVDGRPPPSITPTTVQYPFPNFSWLPRCRLGNSVWRSTCPPSPRAARARNQRPETSFSLRISTPRIDKPRKRHIRPSGLSTLGKIDHDDHLERSHRLPVGSGRDAGKALDDLKLLLRQQAGQFGVAAFAHHQHMQRIAGGLECRLQARTPAQARPAAPPQSWQCRPRS